MYPYFPQYPYFPGQNVQPSHSGPPPGFTAVPHEHQTYCGSVGGEKKHLVMHHGGYVTKPHTPHKINGWEY